MSILPHSARLVYTNFRLLMKTRTTLGKYNDTGRALTSVNDCDITYIRVNVLCDLRVTKIVNAIVSSRQERKGQFLVLIRKKCKLNECTRRRDFENCIQN